MRSFYSNLTCIKETLAHAGHAHTPDTHFWGTLSHHIGALHLSFLHFPIALIFMTACSEILLLLRKKPLYDQAAKFMLLAAFILIIPTLLTGLAYCYGIHYNSELTGYLKWHSFFGFSTGFLTFLAYFLRETGHRKIYLGILPLLLLTTTIAGFFGGEMAF